jgi:hypothetical protein
MIVDRCEECGGELTPHDSDHAQVGVLSEYGPHVHVDAGIAPLVLACWDLMLATMSSCEGALPDEPFAYLAFAPGSAERFAQVATATKSESEFGRLPAGSLDRRICESGDDPAGWRWFPGRAWTPGFVVRFPPSDIPELTRRLEVLRWGEG